MKPAILLLLCVFGLFLTFQNVTGDDRAVGLSGEFEFASDRDSDDHLAYDDSEETHELVEYEEQQHYEEEEEASVVSSSPDHAIRALFENRYKQAHRIFWVDNNGDGVEVATVEAGKSAQITTYAGHSFYAMSIEDVPPRRAYPHTITASIGVIRYVLSEESRPKVEVYRHESRRHPAIKLLNARSTAINVKFRSLAPEVDIWYVDHTGKGNYQGNLVFGQESTTLSYEGHIFRFTVAGNPDKVLAEYTMRRDQVQHSTVHSK